MSRILPPILQSIPPQQLKQLERTIGNKLWRITNLYKIRTKDARLINFKFNDIQKKIYETFKAQSPIHQFYLKYRQGGVSTFWLLWWLDETIFTPNTVTGILAHKWESLHHLWNIIEIAWKNFPDEWRPAHAEPTKTRLAFPSIGSEIFISLSIRSIGLNNLHISEWCFCDSQEVESTLGACGPYTNITGESTGNGVGNHGYLTYQDAKKRLGPYDAHFYPWFIQKEYQLSGGVPSTRWTLEERKIAKRALRDYGVTISEGQMQWRRQKKQELKKIFSQEFPENDEEAFLQSGGRFFDTAKAMALLEEARDWERTHPPLEETEDYIKWEDPDPDSIYVAGADVAEGGGSGDWSVLVILNATKKTTAFRYRAQTGIDVFYRVCDKWGNYYRRAWLAIEKNNHGHAVLQGLLENCLYSNLYYRAKPKRYKQPTQIINDPSDRLLRAGWVTDATTKPMMLDALKTAIEEGSDVDVEHFQPDWAVVDVMLLEEVLTVVETSGKLNAESGKHDDIVIAYAIANQLFQQVQMQSRLGKDLGIRVGKTRDVPISSQNIAGFLENTRSR